MKEDKELLLKDLCARLPYKVICKVDNINFEGELREIELSYNMARLYNVENDESENVYVYDCKPYLFPLSSMTKEQKQYLKNRFCYDWDGEPYDLWKFQIEIGDADGLIDWFHENHIDYRGLIPKRAANDATGLNIY